MRAGDLNPRPPAPKSNVKTTRPRRPPDIIFLIKFEFNQIFLPKKPKDGAEVEFVITFDYKKVFLATFHLNLN